MMKIPKKFNLFGATIRVSFDNKKLKKEECIGLSEYNQCQITLTDESRGEKLSEDVIINTFYHEKVHIILDMMNERKLSKSEQFVDVFSKLLRQADESAEF